MKVFESVWQWIAACTRRVIGLFALIALMTASPCFARNTEAYPALSSHVTDHAQVLGVSAVTLDEKLKAFETATGIQVFVLTIPRTEGRPIDQYAVEVFQQWKLGRAGVDDGVLFVVAVAERRMRIEVGYGLEGTLTDARCARIIRDTVAPQFASGGYEAGIAAGVGAILVALSPVSVAQYPGTESSAPPTRQMIRPAPGVKIVAFVGVLLLGIAIFTIEYGFGGLLLFVMAGMALPMIVFPGTQGILLLLAAVLVWSCIRWRLIANNVRTHQLPGSGNHVLTWIRYFFAPGSGTPEVRGRRNAFTVNVSFNAGSDDRGSSNDGGSSGHGGRSGGGGASGSW